MHAVGGSEPLVLAVMGRAGAGKSALARALSLELHWPACSSDQTRKEIAGQPLFERGNAGSRATLYSDEMTRRTYDKLFVKVVNFARRGTSVILDATFGKRAHREQLRARMGELGFALRFVEAQADDETVKSRLRDRDGRNDEISDARLEDFELLSHAYEPPSMLEGTDLCVVGTAGSPQETVSAALQALARVSIATTRT